MTPPLAVTRAGEPFREITTPLTLPFTMFRLASGVLSHTGTPADCSPARSPAAVAWPMVSGAWPRSAAAVPRAMHSAATAVPLALTVASSSHL